MVIFFAFTFCVAVRVGKFAKLQFPKTGRLLLIGITHRELPFWPTMVGQKGENFDFGGT